MILRSLQFLAVILTALALVPLGAHFFELPNKIALDRAQYFTVQSIYLGWWMLGLVQVGAGLATLALALMLRGQPASFWFAATACVGIAATLVIFFAWTFPANVATNNWMIMPENWQALRTQWEYSHAASAVIMFASLCLLMLSLLTAPSKSAPAS